MSLDNMQLHGVLCSLVDSVWPEVAPMLEKSVTYSDGKYLLEDILKAIRSREMQLWVAVNNHGLQACCVTQIICYPRKKSMVLAFCSGIDFDQWGHFIEDLKVYAKKQGCQAMESYSRPGFEKKFKPYDMEKIHTIFRINL